MFNLLGGADSQINSFEPGLKSRELHYIFCLSATSPHLGSSSVAWIMFGPCLDVKYRHRDANLEMIQE